MSSAVRVLIVGEDSEAIASIREFLLQRGCLVQTSGGGAEAERLIDGQNHDLLIVEERIGSASWTDCLDRLRRRRSSAKLVVMSRHRSVQKALSCVRQGASEYLAIPFGEADLFAVLRRTLGPRWTQDEGSLGAASLRRALAGPERSIEQRRSGTGGEGARVTTASRKTIRKNAEIIERALAFFGFDGVGLSVGDLTEDCLVMEGCNGYVCVTVNDRESFRNVHVESRRWNALVDVFLNCL